MERLEEMVYRRQTIAGYYNDAVADCEWIVPQYVPDDCINSYWTYTVKYEGEQAAGLSWKEFRKIYMDLGGDGFYAAWSVPYLEPVIRRGVFYGDRGCPVKCPMYKGTVNFERGQCPVAESLQPKLMHFKTNYRDLKTAVKKVSILRKTIDRINSRGSRQARESRFRSANV